jgi:hypothetical protein
VGTVGASLSRWGRRPRAGAAPVGGILAAAVLVAGLFAAMPGPVRAETGGATYFNVLYIDDGPCTAGTPCNIQVNAQPNTDNFSDRVHFTSSDPQAILPADYTFMWGIYGDAGFHNFTIFLKTAGLQTITATDVSVSSITGTLDLYVWPGPAARLEEAVPAATTAGAVTQVSLRVEDYWHNLVTDFADTVHFSSTDSGATLPANYTFSHADRGVAWWPVTFRGAGSQSITAIDLAQPGLTDTRTTTVTAAPHLVIDLWTTMSAGASGYSYEVTAVDASGDINTGYVGTIHFTSSDAHADLPADYTFLASDHGDAWIPGLTLKTAGNQYVRVIDVVNGLIEGSDVTWVTPGPSTSVVMAGLPSTVMAGGHVSVKVTLMDSFGNVKTNYVGGSVQFTSSDPLAVFPPVYQFVTADGGTHMFSVTFNTAGAQTLSVAAGSLSGSASTSVFSAGTPATTYTATDPHRVLDTRPTAASGNPTNIGLVGSFTAGTVRSFGVANVHYVKGGSAIAVPAGATAVTGNLTIVNETASGLVALGPTMTPTGEVTTINFVKGDIRANNVTVGLAPDGSLSAVFRSSTVGATIHLIFDVTGYFTPDTTGATYHTVAPGRVLDSRATTSGHTNIGLSGTFKTKVPRTFKVAGVKALGWSSALVPSGASAVTGNLTVTNATSVGYVSVGPTMAAVPSTSTVNVAKGVNRANGVTVKLNGGKLAAVWVGTTGSSADVIFDVTGYFTADLTGLRYHAIDPERHLNTSIGEGLSGAFANKASRSLGVAGVGQIPSDAAGISGNLTVVGPTSNGFAFISPASVASPTSSTVNTNTGLSCANGFDVALASGNLSLIWVGVTGSTANLQLDVTGYWK